MEYCCYVWAVAPSYHLQLLDKLQKQIRSAVGPSLATSLEPLAHFWNVASLSLFYRYYIAICSSELAQLVQLPYSQRRSTCYSNKLHDFSELFLGVIKMSCQQSLLLQSENLESCNYRMLSFNLWLKWKSRDNSLKTTFTANTYIFTATANISHMKCVWWKC